MLGSLSSFLLPLVALWQYSAAQGVTLVTATIDGNVVTFPYTYSQAAFPTPSPIFDSSAVFSVIGTNTRSTSTRSRTRDRTTTSSETTSSTDSTSSTPVRTTSSRIRSSSSSVSISSSASQTLSTADTTASSATTSSNGIVASGVTSPTRNDASSGGGLSTGAKIGLGVGLGVGLGLILLGLLAFCLYRRRSKSQVASSASSLAQEGKASAMGTSEMNYPVDRAANGSPAPVLVAPPADREPTLPNLELDLDRSPLQVPQAGGATGSGAAATGALAGTAVPFMGPNTESTSSPAVSASPRNQDHVASANTLGTPSRPWDPRANTNRYYSPGRESPSAGSIAGFDFGLGSNQRSGISTREQQFKIPRRPVRSNS